MTSIDTPSFVAVEPEFIAQMKSREIPLRMEFVSSGAKESDLPPSTRLELAIVGRSNVGKSSLLNFMAGEKHLARVSSTPGRTQTINVFSVEKDAFLILDLPGYGFAKSPKETQAHWAKAMEEFFIKRQGLVGVLFLLDIRREVTHEDMVLAQWLKEQGLKIIAVQTKADKVVKSQWTLSRNAQSRALGVPPTRIVTTSSEKRMGLKDLFAAMASVLEDAQK